MTFRHHWFCPNMTIFLFMYLITSPYPLDLYIGIYIGWLKTVLTVLVRNPFLIWEIYIFVVIQLHFTPVDMYYYYDKLSYTCHRYNRSSLHLSFVFTMVPIPVNYYDFLVRELFCSIRIYKYLDKSLEVLCTSFLTTLMSLFI